MGSMKESQVRSSLIGKPWEGSQRSDNTDSQFYNSVFWAIFFPPQNMPIWGTREEKTDLDISQK